MFGYGGKILRINLSNGKISKEEISEEFARKYLGGLGFTTRILYNEVPADVDPLSEANKVIIAPGTFVGTGFPTASKTALSFKSPLTGTFGRNNVGAEMGVQMRKAGYDVFIIEGKSDKPVYIYIKDDVVEIKDASDLWGKDTYETRDILKERYGKKASTAVIGPAGENLSYMAMIDFDMRQAARGGSGAVFGSKKLKAIVCEGTGKVEVKDKEAARKLISEYNRIIREHPATKADMDYGSGEFYSWMNTERGTFPTRNFQWGYFQSVYDNLKEGELSQIDPYYWSPKYMVKHNPCPNCTKPCGRILEIKEGEYEGTRIDGVEYEIMYSLGGTLEIDDAEVLIKLNEIADRMGFDGISAGVTIGWAMEAFEKGLLTKEDLDGIELKFGDGKAAIAVLEKMGRKEGKVGELLINGTKYASEKLGKDSYKFAIHVKGLELPAYDVRGIKGLGLAFAVSVRGACHLTAGVYGLELVGSWWKYENVDRLSADWKGFEVASLENLMTLYDIVGVCKFSRHMFFLERFVPYLKAITGWDWADENYMMTVGERVYNIQKAYNVKAGFSRKDDTLPYRVTHDPIPKGPSAGSYIKEEELQKMLDDYYMARGWSKEGVPTKTKLTILGLPEIAEEIGSGI